MALTVDVAQIALLTAEAFALCSPDLADVLISLEDHCFNLSGAQTWSAIL